MMQKLIFLRVLVLCSAVSSSIIPKEVAPQEDEEVLEGGCKSGHKRMKHLNIDTWLTAEQYQVLLDNGIPVDQRYALSAKNSVPSIYEYPTEFLHSGEILQAISLVNQSALVEDTMSMAAFYTRHYQSATGLESANWVFNTVLDIAISTGHPSVIVSKYNHTFAQFSVIAKFQGSDETLPSIIIGAHQDSIAGGVAGRSPGADDNASGCVTLFDAFRILALNGFSPKATVEFHFYAGEEAGLLGSRAIANAYRDQGLEVAGMLNYDVVGYAGPSGGKRNIWGITDYIDTSLSSFIRSVAEEFSVAPWKTASCGYPCSDHATWDSAGFPAAHIYGAEPTSNLMHSSRDTIDTVDFDHLIEFVKIAIGFVVELGNRGDLSRPQ